MSDFEYLGPYKIGKIIGRGGMGSVYEATHAQSGEEVAVKLIAQHVADDMRFRRRFDAEIETLRRLRHPGIVRLIGYGEEEGRLFYAMELVHGETLQQRIRELKRLGWLPAVDVAIQVTAALKHAHDIGVVHRDLKPANLLLTEDNQVKLVDFGIAKLFGYGDQTLAGSVLGTADYMAPEQAGDGPITPRTDLYALGSVMYAMMAGRSPFAGKKLTQVIESLKHDRAVPLELINPDVPIEVVEIVHHLLEKDPKQRPPTALAVSKRLKATRAGLQRGRTVAIENELTHSGPTTDESTADATRQKQSDTHHSSQGTRQADALDEKPGVSRAAITGNDNLETAATDGAEKHESLLSRSSLHSLDFETEAPLVSPTTFKTVEPDESGLGSNRHNTTASPLNHWLHLISIAGMVAILAGGVYLFVRAVAEPSADALFAALQSAEQEGDLTLNTATIDRFLESYPDDERIAQVQRWQHQAAVERTLKRLSARARRVGGDSRLDPPAHGFLDAMQLRETSSEQAAAHLRAWLDVFAVEQSNAVDQSNAVEQSSAGNTNAEIERLTRLIRTELTRLESEDAQTLANDPRVALLSARIAASQTMNEVERTALLRGLVRLYQNDAWAQPVVERAKELLSADSTLAP